jgi:hypothetical protein
MDEIKIEAESVTATVACQVTPPFASNSFASKKIV